MKISYSLLFILVFALANNGMAQFEDKPNPGNTGGYAFTFIDHATDATIGDYVIIDMKMDAGKDNLGTMQGGVFRIKIPFAHWVEIEADAFFDHWQITDENKEKYGLEDTHRSYDGDLAFKTKIRILTDSKTSMRPAVAFNATVKAAAGDFSSAHRYTDTAGYEFSLLTSKDIYDSNETIIRKVKILTEIAFVAWDTDMAQQNDSFKASTGIELSGEKFKMKVSWLGFFGWQQPSIDKVSTLQFEAARDLKNNFQIYGQGNIGLSKAATPYLIGAGVRYKFPGPKRRTKFKNPYDQ